MSNVVGGFLAGVAVVGFLYFLYVKFSAPKKSTGSGGGGGGGNEDRPDKR